MRSIRLTRQIRRHVLCSSPERAAASHRRTIRHPHSTPISLDWLSCGSTRLRIQKANSISCGFPGTYILTLTAQTDSPRSETVTNRLPRRLLLISLTGALSRGGGTCNCRAQGVGQYMAVIPRRSLRHCAPHRRLHSLLEATSRVQAHSRFALAAVHCAHHVT